MLFGDMTATDARRELPLPARLLDALSGVFIVTLLCVLIFGPVRVDAVVATLSVSSLARLLVLLAASVAVRHLAWPRPPLHLRFLAAARALAGSVALRRALPPFLATRGAVLFTGVLAILTIGFPDGEPPVRISESEVVNLPLRWDAGWYLDIAVHGYRWSPAAEGQQNVAFFPAYPALMSLGAALVNAGNEPEGLGVRLSYERYYVWHLAAGLVVALAAFLWGLAYVYRLAREDLDDRSATRAVLLLCAFPFAVFYGAPYSESLFLLVTVAAFFHARRGEWGAACVWGALAGLTRPNGFVLCIPLALLALQARARSPRAWLAVAAPLGGLAAFSLYLLAHTGNPLAWLDAHAAWGRSISVTDMLFAFPLEFRSGEVLYNRTLGEPLRWLDGAAAILALALVVPLTRRLGWAYGSWVVVNLALAIGSGGLLSVGRVVSTLFPLFIYLGARLTPGQSGPALVVFALLQGLGAALFYTWRPFL